VVLKYCFIVGSKNFYSFLKKQGFSSNELIDIKQPFSVIYSHWLTFSYFMSVVIRTMLPWSCIKYNLCDNLICMKQIQFAVTPQSFAFRLATQHQSNDLNLPSSSVMEWRSRKKRGDSVRYKTFLGMEWRKEENERIVW